MKVQVKKDALKIPNLFGYFRIVLAFIFAYLYLNASTPSDYYIAAGVIALSGLSDFADGRIARKFHMITDFGKILDPIADKTTQGIIAGCLATKFPMMLVLIALFLIKEGYLAIVGLKILKKVDRNEGAKWYGKVSTVLLYFITFIMILFPEMPESMANILIGICFAAMLGAFILYIRLYRSLLADRPL